MLTALLSHTAFREMIADFVLFACLTFAWYFPRIGNGLFHRLEVLGSRLAHHQRLVIVAIAALTIVLRLSLLWILPVPIPVIQDEFSYLLAADTFAHGRLTNPPSPFWIFFDEVHVNQLPTYMSKYPPAQGAILAIGQLLGHPFIGVVLSAAIMCAAILWMLQGWLPPEWALLGGTLVLLRLGIFTYWIDSYWGGAVTAIGGALVLGTLPRILHFQRPRDAVLLALGAAILLNSRPFEGAILCLPVAVVLLVWLCGRCRPPWRAVLPRVVAPLLAVAVPCALFVLYYNWRLTGNALLFPYLLNDRLYFRTPDFIWSKAMPPLHYANAQFEAFYNGWSRNYWLANRMDTFPHLLRHLAMVTAKFVYFFLWPELCVPLLALPWLLRDRRVRLVVFEAVFCFLALLPVVWFEPHYAAPAVAAVFAVVTQGLRHLRRWKVDGRPVGIGLSRVVVLAAVILALLHQRAGTFSPTANAATPRITYRAQFAARLNSLPGQHLVIVRYGPVSTEAGEWIYNGADRDRAKIVWARDIPGLDIGPLLRHFSGRRVWLAEPDAAIPRLGPYLVDAKP